MLLYTEVKRHEMTYFKLDDSSLVVVDVAVVWCREDGDNDWKF